VSKPSTRTRSRKAPAPTRATATVTAATTRVPGKRGPKVDVEQTARRKREIIRGAAQLFDRVGYHGVNMTMIAEAAGVKKPTLYHYIRSKDEILFGLHELTIGSLQRNLDERIAAGAAPLECLRGVIIDTFQQLHDYPGYVRAFFEHFRELGREQREQIGVKRDAFVAQVTGIIERAMAAGLVNGADPQLTAHCLFGIASWSYQWYRPTKDPAPEQLSQQCWEIFLRGLEPRR
jgi:AcrR family transcriptional regulator